MDKLVNPLDHVVTKVLPNIIPRMHSHSPTQFSQTSHCSRDSMFTGTHKHFINDSIKRPMIDIIN